MRTDTFCSVSKLVRIIFCRNSFENFATHVPFFKSFSLVSLHEREDNEQIRSRRIDILTHTFWRVQITVNSVHTVRNTVDTEIKILSKRIETKKAKRAFKATVCGFAVVLPDIEKIKDGVF